MKNKLLLIVLFCLNSLGAAEGGAQIPSLQALALDALMKQSPEDLAAQASAIEKNARVKKRAVNSLLNQLSWKKVQKISPWARMRSLALSDDGSILGAALIAYKADIYHFTSKGYELFKEYPLGDEFAIDSVLSGKGDVFVVITSNNVGQEPKIQIFYVGSNKPRKVLPCDSYSYALALDFSGKCLAVGCRDAARAIDLTTDNVRVFPHARAASTVALSDNGKVLATGCDDGKARIFYLPDDTDQPQRVIDYEKAVSSVSLSGDGAQLLTGCGDGKVEVYDLTNEKNEPIRALKFKGEIFAKLNRRGTVAVSLINPGDELYAYDLDPEKRKIRTKFNGWWLQNALSGTGNILASVELKHKFKGEGASKTIIFARGPERAIFELGKPVDNITALEALELLKRDKK